MFEDALAVSQVRRPSLMERWPALASFSFQIAIAITMITFPALHPAKLAVHPKMPHVLIAPLQKPPLPVQRVEAAMSSASTALPEMPQAFTKAPVIRGLLPQNDAQSFPLPISQGNEMGGDAPINAVLAAAAPGPHITVASSHTTAGPVHVSSGVSAGLLLAPIRPIYPEIARIARVQGTVTIEAVITTRGTIDRMYVVSGPPMLREAALDAIHAAHYKPYRLNGVPIEVQTTISVSFHLAN